MFFTPISRLMFLCVAKHYKACLMGPKPSSLGGKLAGQGLGCNGPSEQLDIWVLSERRRGWMEGVGE